MVLAAMRNHSSMNGVAIQHITLICLILAAILTPSTLLETSFSFPQSRSSSSHGLTSFPIALRLGLNGKAKPEGQWRPIVKPAGVPGWEIFHQVVQQFGDVQPFLEEQAELSSATRSKLLQILADPLSNACQKIELAAVIDAAESFVKATYTLEEDGPLALN